MNFLAQMTPQLPPLPDGPAIENVRGPIEASGFSITQVVIATILGGILAFESDWSPAMGKSFTKAIEGTVGDHLLDVGCIAAHGHFYLDSSGRPPV